MNLNCADFRNKLVDENGCKDILEELKDEKLPLVMWGGKYVL